MRESRCRRIDDCPSDFTGELERFFHARLPPRLGHGRHHQPSAAVWVGGMPSPMLKTIRTGGLACEFPSESRSKPTCFM
jgi:hypothetical protein